MVAQDGHKKILLDPNRKTISDFVFVSHAHTDHLHRTNNEDIRSVTLTSKETFLIATERGYSLGDIAEEHPGFELLHSGHILGSKGLLIDNELYYTGDLSTRSRSFMRPAILPHADTLIIESTFGRPEYVFPEISSLVQLVNKIISECYDRGIPVVLMGYQLGKAQLLTQLFEHWEPMYIYDSVHRINSLYRALGVKLKESSTFLDAERKGKIRKGLPWLLIAPLMNHKNKFIRSLKDRYNAITIGFSGWAVNKRYKFMMGLDYALPMSDHCDFRELLIVVEKVQPKKVYTFHGFAAEFATTLNAMGFEASALQKATNQKRSSSGHVKNSKLDPFL
jgi:putative mRNA 3-end processing factor